MKTLKIFGWLSHFLWASMLILTFFFLILIYGEYTSSSASDWSIRFLGKDVLAVDNKFYLLFFMTVCYIIYLIYFYAITLFNLCVRKFEKKIFFDQSIIKRFKKIGLIFIINYIILFILGKIFEIHSSVNIQTSTDFSGEVLSKLNAPMGSLIIGFFFLVLSQVFKEAKIQKDENELTI